MKKVISRILSATVFGIGLMAAQPVSAVDSVPASPQPQSAATKSVQAQVDAQKAKDTAVKRDAILGEAVSALQQTEKALRLLQEKKPKQALAALEAATGKLELILARDPKLALAPVDVQVLTYDLLASTDTVKAMIYDAKNFLDDGEIQKARPILANLASEIVFQTTSIPLATYPAAIKAVSPLIDAGKLDQAKAALLAALRTLVVSEEVIPLPIVRAGHLLASAEKLAENASRNAEDEKRLAALLRAARNQLQMAELLGYGSKELFEPMYRQIDEIEAKTAGGKGGSGWFDKIKQQLGKLL